MSKYQDPESEEVKNNIIEKIKQCPNIGAIKDLVDQVYPGWVITFFKSYSSDYPNFNTNWKKLCIQLGVPQTEIIIVDMVDFTSDKYTLIRMFSELFTRAGFSVRDKKDFIPCSKCNSLLPTEYMYNMLKSRKVPVPKVYSDTCIGNCMRKDSADISDK